MIAVELVRIGWQDGDVLEALIIDIVAIRSGGGGGMQTSG